MTDKEPLNTGPSSDAPDGDMPPAPKKEKSKVQILAEETHAGLPDSAKAKLRGFVLGTFLYATYMLICGILQAHGNAFGASEKGCTDDVDDSPAVDAQAYILIFIILIILIIVFESLKNNLIKQTPKELQRCLLALFGELACMGIIALIVFLWSTNKYVLAGWAEMLYGAKDMEHANLLFEKLQVAVFSLMVTFMLLCVFLIDEIVYKGSMFTLYETDFLAKGDSIEIVEKRLLRASMKQTESHWSNPFPRMRSRDLMTQFQYLLIRQRFIEKKERGRSPVPKDFRLHKYLIPLIAEMTSNIIKTHFSTWFLMFFFLTFMFHWASFSSPVVKQNTLWLAGWLLLFLTMFIYYHAKSIKEKLIIPHPLIHRKYAQMRDLDESTAGMKQKLEPEYTMTPQTSKTKNKHQQIMPFGGNAKIVYIKTLQVIIMFSSTFLAVLVTEANSGEGLRAILWSVLPVFVLVFAYLPSTVIEVSICLHIEMCKNYEMVQKVAREIRVEKSVDAMKIVQSMTALVTSAMKLKSKSTAGLNAKKRVLSQDELEELKTAFDVFDLDKSGEIKQDELEKVMNSIGSPMSDNELKLLVKELDADDSGAISFEEFQTRMSISEYPEPSKVAEEMFKIIDTDNNGKLSVKEVGDAIRSWYTGLTDSDINFVLCELNMEGNAQISKQQFVKAIAEMAGQ